MEEGIAIQHYLSIWKVQESLKPLVMETIQNCFPDGYKDKVVENDLSLEELVHFYSHVNSYENINCFIICAILIRSEIDPPFDMPGCIKILSFYENLSVLMNFQENSGLDVINSLLIRQINSIKNCEELIQYASLIHKINKRLSTNYSDPLSLIELKFSQIIYELIQSSDPKNLVLSLSLIIKGQKLEFDYLNVTKAVLYKTWDYLEDAFDLYQIQKIAIALSTHLGIRFTVIIIYSEV